MSEDEQLKIEAAARVVLHPWIRKIAPFQKVKLTYYINECERAAKEIARRLHLRHGVKIQRSELDTLLDSMLDMAEWRWNPPDHLASGW